MPKSKIDAARNTAHSLIFKMFPSKQKDKYCQVPPPPSMEQPSHKLNKEQGDPSKGISSCVLLLLLKNQN